MIHRIFSSPARKLLLSWLQFVYLFSVHSQEVPQEELTEAPESLWEAELGDQNVELKLEGSWEIQAMGGTGFSLGKKGLGAPEGFPGLTLGWLFTQSPLLKLELRMDRRYFFRADYRGDWANSSFLLGYEGLEKEQFRWLKAGTEPFSVPVYGGWSLGEGKKGNLQGAFGWDSSLSSHDLVLRQESGKRQVRTYRGTRETQILTWTLDQWTRGELYRLPGAPLRNLRLLVEDQSGIRSPAGGELSWSEATGIITPLAWKGHRLYLSWDGLATSGIPPGDTVFLPGDPSPFLVIDRLREGNFGESMNIYRPSGQGVPKGEALVWVRYRKTADSIPGPWTFLWNPQSSSLEVRGINGTVRPFEDLVPGLYSGTTDKAQDYEIVAEVLSGQEGFLLPRDVIPGTLEVTKNGSRVTSFTYQQESGSLIFPFSVFPQDRISISYETSADLGIQVLGALGNRWNIGPEHYLDVGTVMRWNWDQGGWTTEADQKPARAQVFLDHQYQTQGWSSRLRLEAEGAYPDSTGLLRWYSADGDPYTAPLASRLIRPGSRPLSLQSYLGAGYAPIQNAGRGQLLYRNLSLRDFSGYAGLRAFSEDSQPENYGTGEFTGPYLAGGFQDQARTLLVTEYRMKAGQWVASQNFFEDGRSRDMSALTRMSVHLRSKDPLPPGVRVFFQLGTLGEDLDGDGTIDQVRPDIPGLSFQDGTYELYVPLEEASLRSEDWLEKGWLTPESSSPLTWELTGSVPASWGAPWTVELTEAQRLALKNVNSYRLVVITPEVLPLGQEIEEGIIFSTSPVFLGAGILDEGAFFEEGPLGSPSWTAPDPSSGAQVQGSNSGGLTVRWDSPGWKGVHWGKDVPYGQYRWFQFSARNPENLGFSGTFRLSDSRQRGLLGSFEVPPDGQWHHYRLNLESGELYRDGQIQGAAGKSGNPFLWTDLELVMVSGSPQGTLYFDEFLFYESLFQTKSKASWTGEASGSPWEGVNLSAHWDLQTWSDGTLDFKPSGKASLGPLTFTGETQLTALGSGVMDWESGYSVELQGYGGRLSHKFRENSYKDERLTWESNYGKVLFQGSTFFRKESTGQNLDGLLVLGHPDSKKPGGELKGTFSQESPAAEFLESSFADQWVQSWAYSNWNLQTPSRRTGSGRLGFRAPWDSWIFKMDTSTVWEEKLTQKDFQTTLGVETSWSPEQANSPQAWMVTGRWERKIKASGPQEIFGSWDILFDRWGALWKDYLPRLWAYPGREWAEGFSPLAALPSENHLTSFQFKLTRPRVLSWTDLLPSLWESILQKEQILSGGRWEQSSWENRIETSIINAFGKSGYLSQLPWYNSDQGTLSATTRYVSPASGPAVWDHKVSLKYSFLEKTSSTGLELKVSWGSALTSHSGEIWNEWSWNAPQGWKFPYITPPRNFRPQLVNKISLDYTGTGTQPVSRMFSAYSSRWEFTPQGSLQGHLKWGQEWNSLRYSTVFEAGLKVKLIF